MTIFKVSKSNSEKKKRKRKSVLNIKKVVLKSNDCEQ